MMTTFTVHTKDTAPQGSQAIIQATEQAYGFLPNLMAMLAESPAAVEAYATLSGIFDKSDFTATERQIVLMTNNRLNNCTYCMAAHSTISGMQGVPTDVIEALRAGSELADAKLEALRQFTIKVVENRGFVASTDLEAFLSAGYSKGNVLEVIVGTGLKVLSNYTNHVTQTPLDDNFQANAWSSES